MSTPVVRIQEKDQVTIPQEIREKITLQKGDLVTFIETDAGVIIIPVEIVVTEDLGEIGRALKEKGDILEEIIERGREIRGELIDEDYNFTDSQPE